jgi:enoyl-CoA hydratase
VLACRGRTFCAGADITEFGKPKREPSLQAAIAELEASAKPIVAALHGTALGGGLEVALGCHFRVAVPSARMGLPEINLGIFPGAGGTQRLTRAVGKSVAMDVILTGRALSAREALGYGLVARVVAKEAWLAEAKRVARAIAEKSPIAVRLAKEAVDKAFEAPLSVGLEYERRAFYLARASEDADEGLRAFVEKRKPNFRGR